MKELRKTREPEESLLYHEVMGIRPTKPVDRNKRCSDLEKKLSNLASRLGFSVPALLEEIEHSPTCTDEYDEARTLWRHIGLLKSAP